MGLELRGTVCNGVSGGIQVGDSIDASASRSVGLVTAIYNDSNLSTAWDGPAAVL